MWKGETNDAEVHKPVGSVPHSGGGFHLSSWRRLWWLPISSGTISALVWTGGQLCLRNKAQHNFTAQGRRPRKTNHVAIWGDIQWKVILETAAYFHPRRVYLAAVVACLCRWQMKSLAYEGLQDRGCAAVRSVLGVQVLSHRVIKSFNSTIMY